jgi:hypothetical protein
VLPALGYIRRADVDDITADSFGGRDDDVVVLHYLESVKWFASGRDVEDTSVDRIWDGIVDELA